MNLGLDVLGGARYGKVLLNNWPADFWAGFFTSLDGFGDALPIITKLARTGKCPGMRLHLMWRDAHDYEQQFPAILKEARRVKAGIENLLNVAWEISPACEHGLKKPQALSLCKQVQAIFGTTATVVNCPSQHFSGASLKEFKNEVHGKEKPRVGTYNYSWDGNSCVDGNVTASKKLHEKCDTYYFWVPQFNGRKNEADGTPRPERKAWPTKQLIESVVYLKNKKGRTSLPNLHLWKSHADQHETPPEQRASKPVYIAPMKVVSISLVSVDGQVLAKMPYYGPFAEDRHRYYLSMFGYELSELAIKKSGSPIVTLMSGDFAIGKVNAAFRENEYR